MDPTEPVQPTEGQGGEATSDAPYAEYLNRIPEEVRGQVEPVFKDWDANVTRRFQDAAEYRKSWEPYEQIGVNQLDPQELQELVQFRDALSQPEVIQQWYEQYAQANGLTPQQAAEQQQAQEVDFFTGDKDQIEKLLEERLGPLQQEVQSWSQRWEQQQYEARVADAERYVEDQLAGLQEKHGSQFNRDLVEAFVAQYIESDPENAVSRAWEDAQKFVSQVQKDTLQQKLNQPAPAESGGVPDVNPDMPKDLKSASEVALQMLRGAGAA